MIQVSDLCAHCSSCADLINQDVARQNVGTILTVWPPAGNGRAAFARRGDECGRLACPHHCSWHAHHEGLSHRGRDIARTHFRSCSTAQPDAALFKVQEKKICPSVPGLMVSDAARTLRAEQARRALRALQAVLDERLVLVSGTALEAYYREQLLPPFAIAYGEIAAACVQLSRRMAGHPDSQVTAGRRSLADLEVAY